MAGNFDNIIREVLNSTQTHKAGDVVPFPEPLMQDEQPEHFWLDHEFNMDRPSGRSIQQWYQSLQPANEANLGSQILRS